MRRLRLGTRRSRLALIQSELVARRLRDLGVVVDLVEIVTEGDLRPKDAPIEEGVFVATLESALRSHEIDLAVHSAKDVPLDVDPELPLIAFPERADPCDVLVSRNREKSLSDLPFGATVGTDSLRRTAFAHTKRPDLRVVPLMGNVDVRVARLEAGEVDALILAAAGLDRLGLSHRVSVRLEPGSMPPAPAQGALVIQSRRDEPELLGILGQVDDPKVRIEVTTERTLLKAFGGGYSAPVGALAKYCGGSDVSFIAGAATPDGSSCCVLNAVLDVNDLVSGVATIARALHQRVNFATRAVLDTRPEPNRQLTSRFRRLGFRTVHVPTLAITWIPDSSDLERAREELADYDWVVLTSQRGVHALFDGFSGAVPSNVRWAAVGPTTERALTDRGITVHARPRLSVGEAIPAAIAEIAPLTGARVLLPRSGVADGSLPHVLQRHGAHVHEVVAYQPHVAPIDSAEPLRRALLDPELEVIVFASGSAVRGLCELSGDALPKARRLPVFTIGPKTSEAALAAGFDVTAEAVSPDGTGLSAALARGLREEVRKWLALQTATFA